MLQAFGRHQDHDHQDHRLKCKLLIAPEDVAVNSSEGGHWPLIFYRDFDSIGNIRKKDKFE